jgi:carbonic anhydrase
LQSIGRSVLETDCQAVAGSSEADRLATVDQVARRNVIRTFAELIAMSPAIREVIGSTEVGIVGMMYDVGLGTVEVIEETLLGLAGTSNESISAKSQ